MSKTLVNARKMAVRKKSPFFGEFSRIFQEAIFRPDSQPDSTEDFNKIVDNPSGKGYDEERNTHHAKRRYRPHVGR